MTLPAAAAEVLSDHVLFEIESIDRMYLNLYQPRLQHGAGIAAFFVGHRGNRFASSALMAPVTAAFTADIRHFINARGLDLVRFAPGQRKDDVTQAYLREAAPGARGLVPGQVLYAGVAQEKQEVFRTSKRTSPVTGATYPWLVPSTGVVNQYCWYCVDDDFGPVCFKFSAYFPYAGRVILNGNEYARRQAAKAGIGFTPLDNAFAATGDPAAVQALCDGLDEDKSTALAARWLAVLPHPFTADDIPKGACWLNLQEGWWRIFRKTALAGQTFAGMPVTSLRVQALLSALCAFRLLPNGFTNRDLRAHLAPLLGLAPEDMTSGQITCDLRRLRVHGLIRRIPHSFRYQVTDAGIRRALFLTRLVQRMMIPGLAVLSDPGPPAPSRLRAAARACETAMDDLARQARIAA